MVVPIVIAIGIGAAAVVAAVAVLAWTHILGWAREVLEPWIEDHIPYALPWIRHAFASVDKVAAPLLKLAREAWANVRKHLIHAVAVFEQETSSVWVMRMTSWLREALSPMDAEASISKIVTEKRVSFEDLPSQVREAWIRHRSGYEIDLTKVRDEELEMQN
jgi:hypothetical protein